MPLCKHVQHLRGVAVSSAAPAHPNWPFYFFYFLQSWHVVTLQSAGAGLSLELRNTCPAPLPCPPNFGPPPHCVCCQDCGSSVPEHLSCVGSLPSSCLSSSCLPFPFPFLLALLLPFFLFPLSLFCLKNIAAICAITCSKLHFSPIKTINSDSSIEAV